MTKVFTVSEKVFDKLSYDVQQELATEFVNNLTAKMSKKKIAQLETATAKEMAKMLDIPVFLADAYINANPILDM